MVRTNKKMTKITWHLQLTAWHGGYRWSREKLCYSLHDYSASRTPGAVDEKLNFLLHITASLGIACVPLLLILRLPYDGTFRVTRSVEVPCLLAGRGLCVLRCFLSIYSFISLRSLLVSEIPLMFSIWMPGRQKPVVFTSVLLHLRHQ